MQEIDNRSKQIEDLKAKLDGTQRKVEKSDEKCYNIEKEKNQLLKVCTFTKIIQINPVSCKYTILLDAMIIRRVVM